MDLALALPPRLVLLENTSEIVRGIIAVGNPAIWWLSVPASVWALVTGVRARDPRRLFAGAGFCLLYLPWGLSPRTLNYSHYLFEAIPYACLSLAMLLDRWWDEGRAPPRPKLLVAAVAALPGVRAPPDRAAHPPSWFFGASSARRVWTWFPSWI